jgi:acyl-CoA synthetase (NDP forming)
MNDISVPVTNPAPNLSPLLDAKSIVIIGASNNYERTGGIPVNTLLRLGYTQEQLLLVNPRYSSIEDFPCYPDVESLPWTPDLAVVAVRASETLPTLLRVHEKGIRAAVLFASGFAEEHSPEGEQMQREIIDFAAATGMVISGPNCLGHANFKTRSFATFLKGFDVPLPSGPVGVIAQSGNMAAILMVLGMQAGLSYSYFVNTGNEACIEFSQYLDYMARDPETRAILGYVEQLRDGGLFLDVAARMRAENKALFLLKVGTSDKAVEAAASHTAAMAGNAKVYTAALRQAGAAIAGDPAGIIDLGKLWKTGRRPSGRRCCIVSVSGAGCAILADRLADVNVEVPTLPEDVQEKLKTILPAYGMWSNPVDLTGQVTNDISFFRAVLQALVETDSLDCVIFYIMGYLLDLVAPELIAAAPHTAKLLVAIDPSNAKSVPALQEAGVAVFPEITRAATAIGGYLDWSERSHAPAWQPVALPSLQAGSRSSLNEADAKNFLKQYGMPVVEERIAATREAAIEAARELGFPVAVKVLSADILHKTDVGGVRLGVTDAAQAGEAFDAVTGSARAALPAARIDGVTVQQQISGGVGILLGITRDQVFGPVLTVGLGGVLTEIYQDIAIRVLPIDRHIADEMLHELKCFQILNGFRGAPLCDREALIEIMVALSDMMRDNGAGIAEVEINPVLVRPVGQGAVIVDALVSLQAG